MRFYDTYPGFHNVISNNIISGDQDTVANTDGNGIIMDMSGTTSATGVSNANTPPALIINNVVYQNSGDCIVNFTVSNIWTVNNSCYKNNLNTNSTFTGSHAGEIGDNASKQDVFVNNISYTWKQSIPAYFSNNGSIMGTWYRNMYYGGPIGFTPVDPTQFLHADPLYNNPPLVDPSASGQYANAIDPQTIGTAFSLQPGSPAIGKGIDPSTLPGLSAAIISDLRKWIYTDINGNARPQNGSFDLGAFQSSASSPPSPPTNLIAIPH
jgi:hypothetical protein